MVLKEGAFKLTCTYVHVHVHVGLASKREYLEWSTYQTVLLLIKSSVNGRPRYMYMSITFGNIIVIIFFRMRHIQ